ECEEWKFVAMVLDRFFLYLFLGLTISGLWIILRAPSVYDSRPAIDALLSEIAISLTPPTVSISRSPVQYNK
ncbi:Acetylcholine receptor subunit beta-like 2, partial [Armadillidium nasatum]